MDNIKFRAKIIDESHLCLITGLEKCTSYMIDGNVVYLPRPAYDAYTLPEYTAEEKAFYQIKYDMDNDFVEVEKWCAVYIRRFNRGRASKT
ncbi:hypothetical protein AAGS61_07135 [Lysinibacillus sp. KU-BSD001]|uniref:hypothetical protein n=1 Tax=Lysinibacillus sp. KU-BSD001 TaxID=3141328 RepID=UPI0036EB3353